MYGAGDNFELSQTIKKWKWGEMGRVGRLRSHIRVKMIDR